MTRTVRNSASSRERSIVVFATAWGPRYGGINAFNFGLCSALPQVLAKHRVYCIALTATVFEINEAEGLGVTLISLSREFDHDFDAVSADDIHAQLSRKLSIQTVDWWVGHDVKSGNAAQAMSLLARRGRNVLILHMSYADYQYTKHPGSDLAAKAIKGQRALFSKADMAFGVGPLLHDRVREMRAQAAPSERLIPGLPEPANGLPQSRLSAITFGRFEPTEALIKQTPLAVAGFSSAVGKGRRMGVQAFEDATLHVIGVPDKQTASNLTKLTERHAGRLLNIGIHNFIEDRAELRSRLIQSNLSMMLSWHEGFGLTGWEAIGTGIPTIISKGSGVFRLLNEVGGQATGCLHVIDVRGSSSNAAINATDLSELTETILKIGMNLPKYIKDADQLSRLMRTQLCYTWLATSTEFAKSLELPLKLDTVGPTGLDREILNETQETSEPLHAAETSSALRLAVAFIERGQYDNALTTLDDVGNASSSKILRVDISLLRAEALLRLSRYSEAEELALAVTKLKAVPDARQKLRAGGILNTICRDRGDYDNAVDIGRSLVSMAALHCPEDIGSAKRKLARALALRGDWEEAQKEAKEALLLAKVTPNAADQAKALLALGEAKRHGLDQVGAISAYTSSRDLAARIGHVDCYLWAALGLADSLFLVGEVAESDSFLKRLEAFLDSASQKYPLEALHISLSRLVIQRFNGASVETELQQLLAEYTRREVRWPRGYIDGLQRGDYLVPKRF